MKKRGMVQPSGARLGGFNHFSSTVLSVFAYICIAFGVFFLLVGLMNEGWAALGSADFLAFNTMLFVGALLLFKLSDRSRCC